MTFSSSNPLRTSAWRAFSALSSSGKTITTEPVGLKTPNDSRNRGFACMPSPPLRHSPHHVLLVQGGCQSQATESTRTCRKDRRIFPRIPGFRGHPADSCQLEDLRFDAEDLSCSRNGRRLTRDEI